MRTLGISRPAIVWHVFYAYNLAMVDAGFDAIILGAGMAGLAAARTLVVAGMRVVILEAKDRVGGRILTRHFREETVELGAEFVHGKPVSLWKLIEEAGVATYELDGQQFCWRDESLNECGADFSDNMQWMEALKEWKGADCSFAEYLDRANVPEASRAELISYVEGFNAADHHLIGVASLGKQQVAEDASEGDRLFCIRGGYSQLPEFLAHEFTKAGGTIAKNTSVERVVWEPGRVEVRCAGRGCPEKFRAPRVIVTLPLAVLQSGNVQFSPGLRHVQEAMTGLRMGHVCRMVMLFRERFWEQIKEPNGLQAFRNMSFLFNIPGSLPTWWTQSPENSSKMTAWAGGPRADLLAEASPYEIAHSALGTLSKVFGLEPVRVRDLLLHTELHDWQRDPYAFGAYSYAAVDGLTAPETMARPVESTIFLAGEHTDLTGNWGTVHAAMDSGIRAAQQVLRLRSV